MKHRVIVLMMLCAVFAARHASAAGSDVSVAVVPADAQAVPVAALVEVGLSQEGVRLVERTEIDRVLQEQELSAAGLSDRAALVKVGALLRADAFLLLSVEEPPKKEGAEQTPGLLRMRLTETAHGVRLLDWYAAWEPEKVEDAAARVVEEVTGPLAKLTLPAGDLIPVGIVDIHRVLLDEEHQWLCRALKVMLSSRLSKEPRIVVLEREDLLLLQQEKGLSEGGQDAFWSSGVLVEGTLERVGTDKMALRLEVRPAGGEPRELASVPVDPDVPGQACERVALEAIRSITEAPSAGTWNAEDEAAEFRHQGAMLAAHRRSPAALPLLETAAALAPGNVPCAVDLFRCARVLVASREGSYSGVQMAELASRCAALVQQTRKDGGEWGAPEALLAWELSVYLTAKGRPSDERAAAINRGTRRTVQALMTDMRERAPVKEDELPLVLRAAPELAVMGASTVEEGVEAIKDLVARSIAPGARAEDARSFAARCDAAMGITKGMPRVLSGNAAAHLFFQDCELPKRLFAYFAEMAASGDPLARFCGCMLCTNKVRAAKGYGEPEWEPPIDATASLQQAIDVFEKYLQARADVSEAAAVAMRAALSSGARERLPAVERLALAERFLAPLAERGDVDGLMLWRDGLGASDFFPSRRVSPETAARYMALADRVTAVLEADAARPDVAAALPSRWWVNERLRDELRQYLAHNDGSEVLRLLPELGRPPDRQVSAAMLVRDTDWFHGWEFRKSGDIFSMCVLEGRHLWVAIADSGRDRTVGLVGVDLADRRLLALWQTTIPASHDGFLDLAGVAVSPERSYVAVRGIGLIEFPGSDTAGKALLEQPRILGQEDGLPPGDVSGLAAAAAGKLWVGYGGPGGCGLGLFDPRTGRWESILLSTRRGETPLEGGIPYRPRSFLPVPEGLLFIASLSQPGPVPTGDLWLLRADSAMPEDLANVPTHLSPLLVDSPAGPLFVDADAIGRLGLEEGRFELLMADGQGLRSCGPVAGQKLSLVRRPFVQGRAKANPELFADGLGCIRGRDAAVHGNELWAPYGETQIIIIHRGTTMRDAEFIPNNALDGKAACRFLDTPYGLVAIGERGVGLIEEGP